MTKEKRDTLLGMIALLAVVAILGVAAYLTRTVPAQPSVTQPTVSTTVPTEPTEPQPTLIPSPYTSEDLVMEDGFMKLLNGETITGIDVSYHQKEIDWQQVKDAGIDFVIVRLGYRGYETGKMNPDKRVYENLNGAKEAGLLVGAYFYSQAINPVEAAQEAAFALRILDGFPLDLPVVYDWEFVTEAARTDNMDGETLTECVVAFCETIRSGGYDPMVYFNPYMVKNDYFDLFRLQDKGYPFWLAHFTDTLTFPHKVELWQYSCTGQVPGITGNVDLNIMFPEYSDALTKE